jgi:hypothetical protein
LRQCMIKACRSQAAIFIRIPTTCSPGLSSNRLNKCRTKRHSSRCCSSRSIGTIRLIRMRHIRSRFWAGFRWDLRQYRLHHLLTQAMRADGVGTVGRQRREPPEPFVGRSSRWYDQRYPRPHQVDTGFVRRPGNPETAARRNDLDHFDQDRRTHFRRIAGRSVWLRARSRKGVSSRTRRQLLVLSRDDIRLSGHFCVLATVRPSDYRRDKQPAARPRGSIGCRSDRRRVSSFAEAGAYPLIKVALFPEVHPSLAAEGEAFRSNIARTSPDRRSLNKKAYARTVPWLLAVCR